jgi:transmembrane sensor
MIDGPHRADKPAGDAAIMWRARLDSGAMSASERLAFERWLAAPANAASFARLEAALARLDDDGAEILAREYERELQAAAARPFLQRRAAALAAAAALVALAIPTALLLGRPAAPVAFATGVGEKRTVALADGSRVTLSTDTKITALIGAGRRKVALERGEALFEVAPDGARPFTVATTRADVVVAGTVFDVRAAGGLSSVYVISGAVEVRSPSGEGATLLAGDSISVGASGPSGVARFDANVVLAWRRDRLKFVDARLAEALAELNRHYAIPIALDGASLSALPLSGDVPTNDQDAAVRAIAMAFDLDVRKEADRIVLFRGEE